MPEGDGPDESKEGPVAAADWDLIEGLSEVELCELGARAQLSQQTHGTLKTLIGYRSLGLVNPIVHRAAVRPGEVVRPAPLVGVLLAD